MTPRYRSTCILNQKRNFPCVYMQTTTNMKIRIKLDLHVLKEYFIATLCEKKNVGEGLSRSSEMVVEMWKDSLTKISFIPGMTTFSMKDCLASLAHRTDKF